jgi:hypothetical protein
VDVRLQGGQWACTYICDSAHSLIVDDGVLLHFLCPLVEDLSNKDLDLGVLCGFCRAKGSSQQSVSDIT